MREREAAGAAGSLVASVTHWEQRRVCLDPEHTGLVPDAAGGRDFDGIPRTSRAQMTGCVLEGGPGRSQGTFFLLEVSVILVAFILAPGM